jgi:DinB superfamily
MDISALISGIRTLLQHTFTSVDEWFDKPSALRGYSPKNGGWSIDLILEHIGLTNHFLLILIDKGAQKALNKSIQLDLNEALSTYNFQQEKLDQVGVHLSFPWVRPEHMEPLGHKTPAEVRQQLQTQLQQCLNTIDRLKKGEGVLYRTTMTVNDLGKIDVYQYLYFLAQHAKRHVGQMEKVELEYQEKVN